MEHRTMKRSHVAAFALCAALTAFPALAHDPVEHGAEDDAIGVPGDAKQVARTVTVTASDDMRFNPKTITAIRGQTVRIVVRNAGKTKHEFMLGTEAELIEHAKLMQKYPEMEHDEPNAVTVGPGETRDIVWRFTKDGAVAFGCLVPGHYEAGMKGRIVVSR